MSGQNPSKETLVLSVCTDTKRSTESYKFSYDDLSVDNALNNLSLNPYLEKPSGGILEKSKIVDGVFGEEAERDMDGDESISFSLLDSKPQIKISPKVLDELRDEWKNSLIVTLFGKTTEYDTLCSKACALWNLQGGFKALDLGKNYFLFTFKSIEDCIHVYTGGPWVVVDHFLLVRKWEPNFKPSEAQRIMISAIWVRFHELPVEFLNDKILYNVAKSLGRPIKVDHSAQGKFARVCIEIDLSKPLCPVIEVDGKDCAVEYESLHSFCFDCGCFGHIKDIKCDEATILEETEPPKTNKFQDGSESKDGDNLNKIKPDETEIGNNSSISIAMENEEKPSDDAEGETSPDSSVDEITNYPDPIFNDFTSTRTEYCFAEGQVWAVYDTMDSMPRHYARINRVIFTSEFKLNITWLRPGSDDEDESKWVNAGLPVSIGEFRKGKTQTIYYYHMFSHQVDWENGNKIDTYKIYPQKGETWAIFKNHDMNWHSYPLKKKYEFEFVEILSDYCEDTGVIISYLGKVKEFSRLFCRIARGGGDSFRVSQRHLFLFSHRVPCFRLSGEEREDVPNNSFELDPASLTSKCKEIDINDLKDEVAISEEDSHACNVKDEVELNSISDDPVPHPEFDNFDGRRAEEEFLVGQIWALYSYADGMPKCYGLIKRIDYEPEFMLHVTWLFASPTNNGLQYADKRMHVGCGIFQRSNYGMRTGRFTFSHRLNVHSNYKMHEFAIVPRNGEVWAVYKNWTPTMTLSDLQNCEYDIVQVVEEHRFAIKGLVLEMVSGYNSVFKARKHNGSLVTIQIGQLELIKFSHQIPAFQLTDEKGGSLRGYLELDPEAVPIKMFRSS